MRGLDLVRPAHLCPSLTSMPVASPSPAGWRDNAYLPQAQPAPDPHRRAAARHPRHLSSAGGGDQPPTSPVDGRLRGRAYRRQTVALLSYYPGQDDDEEEDGTGIHAVLVAGVHQFWRAGRPYRLFSAHLCPAAGLAEPGEFAQLLALLPTAAGPASSQLGFAIGRHRAGIGGAWPPSSALPSPFLLLLAAAVGWVPQATSGWTPPCTVPRSCWRSSWWRMPCSPHEPPVLQPRRCNGVMVVATAALWVRPGLPDPGRHAARGGPDSVPCASHTEARAPRPLRIASLTGRPCCCSPCCCSSACLVAKAAPSASCWPTFTGRQPGVLAVVTWCCPVCGESLGVHHLSEQQFLTGYGLAQLVPGPMFTLATYLGAVLLPATPLIRALLATWRALPAGFPAALGAGPLLAALAGPPLSGGAVAGINARRWWGLLLAALYQPVWRAP